MTLIRDEKALIAFGKHLARIRQQHGLTQKELAMRSEIDAARVSKIERGVTNVTLSTMICLAGALDITLSKLVAYEADKKSKG